MERNSESTRSKLSNDATGSGLPLRITLQYSRKDRERKMGREIL